eukprot:m.91022 g.91022  ORF g.91022 m.91022 type:complete len:980 (+) comp26441_c1_seq2:222-3161(+)
MVIVFSSVVCFLLLRAPSIGAVFHTLELGVASTDTIAIEDNSNFNVDYLALFESGVGILGLNATDPMILASLYARTGNVTYAQAASANLAATTTGNAPWLASDNVWLNNVTGRQSWLDWDASKKEYDQPARFSGCTDYGLLAYLVLQRSGYDKGWSRELERNYRKMHSTLCYVWFSGAWNQGTWMGIGNTVFSQVYVDEADEHTPWAYPFLTRHQHAEKVYGDFFDQQIMMEDADGYNQIWAAMAMTWPEIWKGGRSHQLNSMGLRQILENFRDYVAPDNQMFQFASGLNDHYSTMYWVATFERAAVVFNDGTFRYAAQQMWQAMGRNNITGPDQSMPSCARNGQCCRDCFNGKTGIPSNAALAVVTSSPWMVSYNLLCSRYLPSRNTRGCGDGGVNTTIVAVPPPNYNKPSSVVHRRREVNDLQMADKIVMTHTKEYLSNRTFVTLEAHTGRSLFHSHSNQVTAIDNFWRNGVRFLGSQGKHDNSAVGNHVMLKQNTAQRSGLAEFPFRNASDQYLPGTYSTMVLPTRTHLPFLDTAGPMYMKRNLSVLGISCDNWLNETVVLTVLPLSLVGPGGKLTIDDFSVTSQLWSREGVAEIVRNNKSDSGFALEITCRVNNTSCGSPNTKDGSCAIGCVLDSGWCHSSKATFVNRRQSTTYALPTEIDADNSIDVDDFEAFNLQWKMSENHKAPSGGTALFPIGVQTVNCAPASNGTLSYYGNSVKQLNIDDSVDIVGHPHQELLGDGEFWPVVDQTLTTANSKADDLYSIIEVSRGFFTSSTATTRQTLALAEGYLVVVDSVGVDDVSRGWLGGPSWQITTGNNAPSLIHARKWPSWWERVNTTWRDERAMSFYGFADVYNETNLSDQRLLIVFPALEHGEITSVVDATIDHTCAITETCPLYAQRATSRYRILNNDVEHFVSVFIPHDGNIDPAALSMNVDSTLSNTECVVTLPNNVSVSFAIGAPGTVPQASAKWAVSR